MILLNEAVSTFESTAAATNLVSRTVGEWRGCAGKSVTLIVDGNPLVLDVGEPIAKRHGHGVAKHPARWQIRFQQ